MAPKKEGKSAQVKDPKALNPETLPKGKIKQELTLLSVHLESARLSTPPSSPTNDQAPPLDDLTAPFNRFHLRRPAPKTCRLTKKQRHTLNLSVAAGGVTKPVLRPARLTALRSFTLLHPPRLSALASETSSAINQVVFTQLQKNTFLPLTQLCDVRKDITNDCSQNKLFGACLTTGCGRKEAELCFKSMKEIKTESSAFSKNSSFAFSSSSSNQVFPNHLSSNPSSSPIPSCDLPANMSHPPSSSCRQQLQRQEEGGRLEDTTPAELASYLDLLLHLPKDMSPMAQAMYA